MSVLACNLQAFSAADRPRYHALVQKVHQAILTRAEISNGFTFEIDEQTIGLTELAEWIGMERLCCPFLTLQLSTSGDQPNFTLTLTGPPGAASIVRSVFP